MAVKKRVKKRQPRKANVKNIQENKLEGIKGWLLAYLIVTIIGWVFLWFVFVGVIILGWYIQAVLVMILLLVDFYAILLIFRKEKKAITWNIIAIALGFIVTTIMDVSSLVKGRLGPVELVINGVFNLAISVIFILYWQRSKRVKNTFKR